MRCNFNSCANRCEEKFDSWSLCMVFGVTKMEINWLRARTTALAVNVRYGYVAGYLMFWHMTVSKYNAPDFEVGRGPTQSIITCSNGWPKAGMGHNGVTLIIWFGLPITWQVWPARLFLKKGMPQNAVVSFRNPHVTGFTRNTLSQNFSGTIIWYTGSPINPSPCDNHLYNNTSFWMT